MQNFQVLLLISRLIAIWLTYVPLSIFRTLKLRFSFRISTQMYFGPLQQPLFTLMQNFKYLVHINCLVHLVPLKYFFPKKKSNLSLVSYPNFRVQALTDRPKLMLYDFVPFSTFRSFKNSDKIFSSFNFGTLEVRMQA